MALASPRAGRGGASASPDSQSPADTATPAGGLPYRTSLGALNDHDWNVLSNRWSRGIDWIVQKVGKRHWELIGFPTVNAGFPLFTTKTAAYDAGSKLILAESHYRSAKRHGLPTYN